MQWLNDAYDWLVVKIALALEKVFGVSEGPKSSGGDDARFDEDDE